MAKNVATILGVVFLIAGVLGFFMPTMGHMHLTPTHNVVHIISGLIALYFGAKGRNVKAAKNFLIVFGIVYGLLGLAGFFAPAGTASVPPMLASKHLLKVIPGHLELGSADNWVHLIVGVISLILGLVQRTVPAAEKERRREAPAT